MRIRGTSHPTCALCVFCTKKDDIITCTLTNEKTEDKASCSKFKYDIFKYTPSANHDFSKFSKEDFEI